MIKCDLSIRPVERCCNEGGAPSVCLCVCVCVCLNVCVCVFACGAHLYAWLCVSILSMFDPSLIHRNGHNKSSTCTESSSQLSEKGKHTHTRVLAAC